LTRAAVDQPDDCLARRILLVKRLFQNSHLDLAMDLLAGQSGSLVDQIA